MMRASAKIQDPACAAFIRLIGSFAAKVHHVQHRSNTQQCHSQINLEYLSCFVPGTFHDLENLDVLKNVHIVEQL